MAIQSEFQFEGFSSPNVTPVPDVLFDYLAPRLSDAELRVLLYIIRRTYGFKKEADAISITQMVEGIRARRDDGTFHVLDEGTGMGRKGVCSGISGLLRKGIIEVERRVTARGDADVNVYRLRFRGTDAATARPAARGPGPKKKVAEQPADGVVPERHHRSIPGEPRVVSQGNGQHDRSQHDRSQQPAGHPESRPETVTDARLPAPVVVVSKIPVKDQPEAVVNASPEVFAQLVAAGVAKKTAKSLCDSNDVETLQVQLDALPFRQAREPAAVLVQSITENWALPKAYVESQRRKEARKKEIDEREKRTQQAADADRAERDRQVQIDAYLAIVTTEERMALEEEAKKRLCEAEDGHFWRDRKIPPAVLRAFLRAVVEERMRCPSYENCREEAEPALRG